MRPTSPSTTLPRSRPPSTTRPRPSCSSRSRARAASGPRRQNTSSPPGRSPPPAAPYSSPTRSRPDSALARPGRSTASGVVPDILVTAKALANGFPIGLTMCTEAISAAIPSGAHGTTFGASPLACRAAIVTLRALRERDLYARSAALGAELMNASPASKVPKCARCAAAA